MTDQCDGNSTITSTFRVGNRYRCTITVPVTGIAGTASVRAEWEPDVPKRLSKLELRDYRRGRDAILAEIAKQIGGNIQLAEL